ncbi:flagellar basal body protein [Rhizobium halophytocola]|uniref:Flagellar basal-body rod protein FlgC n=1 Tax=Rhizobium halophytocola TaxID=735519 RepID=A0ABS4DZG2_9HYPH|nr:flagellar basal body protein [Rhizobium halophytocola]MBP1851078.1 flagellar basal-body rod protein FlgC [Rhizobium halophytocola]
MTIAAAMTTAVSGMRAQTTRLSATADNIANSMTPGYDRRVTYLDSPSGAGVTAKVASSGGLPSPTGSNVDLAGEMLDTLTAKTAFQASAAVFETGADMWDVLMSIKRD